MDAFQLPLIPIGEQDSGEYLIFLPGLRTDELTQVGFDVDEEEDVFHVLCQYGEDEDGEPIGESYPIEINEMNRGQIDELQTLAVLHPDDEDVEDLTPNPDAQEELRELFSHVRNLEEQMQPGPGE